MEKDFSDLLSDAFSETSVPSLSDGDLDFENLNFDEKLEGDKTDISHESLPTKEDEALHQEATCQTEVLSCMETRDMYRAENVDEEQSEEEDFQGMAVMSMNKTPEEEDYTSSDGGFEQEGSGSGDEDEEEDMGAGEKPGELLMSVCCSGEFCDSNIEDRIFAEGQPLAPQGDENPQVRNEEQGDSESDEEVSYFERVPERGSEMMIKGDGIEEREEEKQEDSPDSECEGMKIEQEENVLAGCLEQEVENPCRGGPETASLDFPEISVQSLQDLIAEVDSEEHVEKMKEFSGEEHQEAGESFADYPSDFSSCEYVEGGGKNQESNHQSSAKQNTCLERAVTDLTWMGRADEEGDEYLYSIDLEVDAHKFRSPGVAATGEKDGGKIEIVQYVSGDAALTGCDDGGDTSSSDSYSSSDDEGQVRRSDDEELLESTCRGGLESSEQLEELHSGSNAARWGTWDGYSRPTPGDFNINWNLDVLTTDTRLSEEKTTEDTDKTETLLSDAILRPAGDVDTYSVVQRGAATTTSPSNQGSLDDSFFFNTELEASGNTELGQLGDDEYEEERNWEQEQERIKAFFEFYDDSDGENEREGRQIKVQFCTDPLSQVIHYETDSTDRESLSSSTDEEEDPSSAETSEELREPDDTTPIEPACDPPNTQLPEKAPDLCQSTENYTKKHRWLNMLKLTLKMGVVISMGLLMFWLATDEAGWLSQMAFF